MASSSETEVLQAEMKLLNWHKLANDAALKAALMKTKELKDGEKGRMGSPLDDNLRAQAHWMQRVIEEEQAKPLHVSKDFVVGYQEREKVEEERLEREVERHITALKRLRSEIESREKLKAKKEAYKRYRANARQQLETKSSEASSRPNKRQQVASENGRGALGNGMSSLDRLVDLERRIASLESDSIYDRVDQASTTKGGVASSSQQPRKKRRGGGGALRFTKQRVPLSTARPSKDVYAVRLAQRRGSRPAGRTNVYRSTQDAPPRNRRTSDGTASMASGKASRQDQAINRWLQNKKSRNPGTFGSRREGPVFAPTVGASSGRRGRNASQQAFIDMKTQVEKRKDNIRNKLYAGNGGPAAKHPSYRQRKNVYGGASKTGLQSSRLRPNAATSVASRKQPRNTSRMPKIRGAADKAAVSRKTNARRDGGNQASEKLQSLPHVAGGGIQGVRGMKKIWQ